MKNRNIIVGFLTSSVLAFSFANTAEAATSIATSLIGEFQLNVPQTAPVQASGWYNDNFGAAGWTHFSKWGYIRLKAGQKVKVSVQSSKAGLHPGVTCWHEAQGPKYAPLDYFTGHSYIQYNDVIVNNTTDEMSGAKIGNFRMTLAANGYDQDGMTTVSKNLSLNPISDGVPGLVEVSFRAKKKGVYMCVVGGINPDDKTSTTGGFNANMTRIPVTITFSR